jgi:predicted homoserine dehydrogenase-like protein
LFRTAERAEKVDDVIIVDRALEHRQQQGRPVLFGLFGAGAMARGTVNQTERYVQGITAAAICNRTISAALDVYAAAGQTNVVVVETAGQLDDAIRSGQRAVTSNPEALCASELLECLVEITGHIEYGARVSEMAIEHGKHLVLMNAEIDATIGPLLKHRADQKGVVVSGCDGDQPAVQLNLLRTVLGWGLRPLLCGNIKGLQDHYRNPTTQAAFAKQWGQTPNMVTSFADGTKISMEQAVVANATGMGVAKRGMIGPEHRGHIDDMTSMFDVEMLRECGGIVDYVLGALPSPGVFVFAEAQDDQQRRHLDYAKLGSGPLYSFYIPYHLTQFEVADTVARVVLFQDAATTPLRGPVVDVVAAGKIDLAAGTTLDGLGQYMTYGLAENYATARAERLLPIGLAEGCVLTRDLSRDAVLTYDDVVLPVGTDVHRLRAEQDHLFLPVGVALG